MLQILLTVGASATLNTATFFFSFFYSLSSSLTAFKPSRSTPRHQHRRFSEWWKKPECAARHSNPIITACDSPSTKLLCLFQLLALCLCQKLPLIPVLKHQDPFSLRYAISSAPVGGHVKINEGGKSRLCYFLVQLFFFSRRIPK